MSTITSDTTLALRAKISVWYENAILPGRLCAVRGGIAEVNAKSIGFELPNGSLKLIYATWNTLRQQYVLRKDKYDSFQKRFIEQCEAAKLSGLATDEDAPSYVLKNICTSQERKQHKKLREPKLVLSPEDLTSASVEKALRFSESFLKWLELQAVPPRITIELNDWYRLTLALIGLYMSGQAENFLKLKLATLDAISKHQTELPPVNAPFIERSIRAPTLLPGLPGMQLFRWILCSLSRAQAFVFYMKRASAEMSDEQIAAAEEKSFKILTTPHIDTSYRVDFLEKSVTITPETLKEQVTRTVRDCFRGARWNNNQPVRVPSGNAHYKNGRSKGGAKARVAALQPQLVSFLDMLTRVPSLHRLTKSASIKSAIMCGCDGNCGGACASNIRSLSNRGRPHLPKTRQSIVEEASRENSYYRGFLLQLGFCPPNESIGASRLQLVHWFDELTHAWASRDLTQHAHRNANALPAKIIGLPEPLKIRTITAGPEEAYFEASFLQKFVHGHLRQHPVFRLIGQPLTLDDIQQTFKTPLRLNEFFVSGDYKSATDLISGALSACAARTISEVCGMSSQLSDLFVACLTGHEIHQKKQVGLQANGQLMGSPLSFPILCIINAALTRYALEVRNDTVGKTDLGDYPLLINGDDVGFVTDSDGYELWKIITKMGGLVFSAGKNFTSTKFMVLNSCMFELRGQAVPRPMRENTTSRRAFPESNFKLDTVLLPSDGNKVSYPCERTVPLVERAQDYELIVSHGYAKLHDFPRWLQKDYWATSRNVFEVSPYLNPDYLGPVNRRAPSQCTFETVRRILRMFPRGERDVIAKHFGTTYNVKSDFVASSSKLLSLENYKTEVVNIINNAISSRDSLMNTPAFRRFKMNDIEDLFRPEGYAILPGLQQAWLGSHRGIHRHKLNLEFLRTWRPVLDLGSGVTSKGISYTTDYWLPTGLGGFGLENTDPSRTIEASSLASRKLAFWLYHHPEHVPIAMPAIAFKGELAEKAHDKFRELNPSFFPAHAVIPPNFVTQASVIGAIERIAWMETFQLEEDGPIWVRSFMRGERTYALQEGMRNYASSRARLWSTQHSIDGNGNKSMRNLWWSGPAITENMLAAYAPPQRCYALEMPTTPKTELRSLGSSPNLLPLLGLGFVKPLDTLYATELERTIGDASRIIWDAACDEQHTIPLWFGEVQN